jgi:hypothetical protein
LAGRPFVFFLTVSLSIRLHFLVFSCKYVISYSFYFGHSIFFYFTCHQAGKLRYISMKSYMNSLAVPFSEHNYRINRGISVHEHDPEIVQSNGCRKHFADALSRIQTEPTETLTATTELSVDLRTKGDLQHITRHQTNDPRIVTIKESLTAKELAMNQNLLQAACFCWFLAWLTRRTWRQRRYLPP